MGPAAKRLLNVLPGAVVVASMITLSVVPAEAATSAAPGPAPYVVAIDPGHGGSPDNNHPDQLFDPGSVSGTGVLEKDLALDVSRRVQRILEGDQVHVVMTRTGDRYVSFQERMNAAAGAEMFVSVHFNFFQDPAVGGAVLLYPRESDRALAQLMKDALARRLARFHVAGGALTQREDLWPHAPMPVVTVEAAYLTNTTEAQLLTKDAFKQAIAAGIASGVEAQQPGILARKAEILRHRAAAGAHAVAAHNSSPLALPSLPVMPAFPMVQLALLAAMTYLLIHFRRATIPALAFAIAVGSVLHARAAGRTPDLRTRRGVRRRRSRAPMWTGARPY